MDIYTDLIEYNVTHLPAFQSVLDMFDGCPEFQKIVRLGLMANMGYTEGLDDSSEDYYEYDHRRQGHNNPRRSDRGARGDHTKSSKASYPFPMHHYATAHEGPLKESNVEKDGRFFHEAKKKGKDKAEKKRLKKQKQKERKRQEKEKQNAEKKEEENGDGQKSTDENKAVNSKSGSSVKDVASANNVDSSDSSEDASGDEDSNKKELDGSKGELDMKSMFVSKAALIAQRKLEQKPRPENKDKEKCVVKEESKAAPGKPNKKSQGGGAASCPTYEDTIKISTDLANIGNKFASAGDFNKAVTYFTHAIKYNPTEFKLFGNRAFCFERMREYGKALNDAELSLSMNPGWVKGLFRKGRALTGLKRYEEAAQAFRDVLTVDSSCAEAAQELMRVQITQVMEYGFTREQSSNALIIHGTVQKAVEVLSKLNHQAGAVKDPAKTPVPAAQVANVNGVSPVLSATMNPPPSQEAAKAPPKNKPSLPVPPQNVPSVKTQPKPPVSQTRKTKDKLTPELFPIWVGNLYHEVSEEEITDWFSSVGDVYSVKVLPHRQCAFVNFTKAEQCENAITEFDGSLWNGIRLAVRYPDRIPEGMGFSKYAICLAE